MRVVICFTGGGTTADQALSGNLPSTHNSLPFIQTHAISKQTLVKALKEYLFKSSFILESEELPQDKT